MTVVLVAGLTGGSITASAEAATKYAVTVKSTATVAAPGTQVRMTGVVRPRAVGRSVYLQAYLKGSWKTINTQKLSSRSRYAFTPTVGGSGALKLRVLKPRARTHDRGISRVVTITLVKPAPQ